MIPFGDHVLKRENPVTEFVKRHKEETVRYPNLSTVIMVENYLQKHRDMPMTLAQLKVGLPKKVMHQTLKVILVYLWRSGKIMYGPRGIQWIYTEPEHLQNMMNNTLEI